MKRVTNRKFIQLCALAIAVLSLVGMVPMELGDAVWPPPEPPERNFPPWVTINNPANGATVSGVVPIQVTVVDDWDRNLVPTVFINGAYLGTGSTVNWDSVDSALEGSVVTIRAEATDSKGKTGSSTIEVTVENYDQTIITNVFHSPTNPTTNHAVTVTVEMNGELPVNVYLSYTGSSSPLQMTPEIPNQKYTATIGPFLAGSAIYYAVQVVDGDTNPQASGSFQVVEPSKIILVNRTPLESPSMADYIEIKAQVKVATGHSLRPEGVRLEYWTNPTNKQWKVMAYIADSDMEYNAIIGRFEAGTRVYYKVHLLTTDIPVDTPIVSDEFSFNVTTAGPTQIYQITGPTSAVFRHATSRITTTIQHNGNSLTEVRLKYRCLPLGAQYEIPMTKGSETWLTTDYYADIGPVLDGTEAVVYSVKVVCSDRADPLESDDMNYLIIPHSTVALPCDSSHSLTKIWSTIGYTTLEEPIRNARLTARVQLVARTTAAGNDLDFREGKLLPTGEVEYRNFAAQYILSYTLYEITTVEYFLGDLTYGTYYYEFMLGWTDSIFQMVDLTLEYDHIDPLSIFLQKWYDDTYWVNPNDPTMQAWASEWWCWLPNTADQIEQAACQIATTLDEVDVQYYLPLYEIVDLETNMMRYTDFYSDLEQMQDFYADKNQSDRNCYNRAILMLSALRAMNNNDWFFSPLYNLRLVQILNETNVDGSEEYRQHWLVEGLYWKISSGWMSFWVDCWTDGTDGHSAYTEWPYSDPQPESFHGFNVDDYDQTLNLYGRPV